MIGTDKVNKVIIQAYTQSLMKYLTERKGLSKEQVKEAARSINLLATEVDASSKLCADVALFYSNGEIAKIANICKFANFMNFDILELRTVERIFSTLKAELKEPLLQYYTDKADYYGKKIEECNLRKSKIN